MPNEINMTFISLITLTFLIICYLTWLFIKTLKEGRKSLDEMNRFSK